MTGVCASDHLLRYLDERAPGQCEYQAGTLRVQVTRFRVNYPYRNPLGTSYLLFEHLDPYEYGYQKGLVP